MDDGSQKKKNSFVGDLKIEWKLFWEGIVGEEEDLNAKPDKDALIIERLEVLSAEQIKALTKALSSDRKKLNQRMESLSKEIEENSQKIDSLKLVGAEVEDTEAHINELHDLGQNISEQLDKINIRLKLARKREAALKKAQIEL